MPKCSIWKSTRKSQLYTSMAFLGWRKQEDIAEADSWDALIDRVWLTIP